MRFVVDRLDHLVITCRDVERMAGWYQRVLGMEREAYGPHRRTALKFGGQKINLRPDSATQDEWGSGLWPMPGSQDLCFIVTYRAAGRAGASARLRGGGGGRAGGARRRAGADSLRLLPRSRGQSDRDRLLWRGVRAGAPAQAVLHPGRASHLAWRSSRLSGRCWRRRRRRGEAAVGADRRARRHPATGGAAGLGAAAVRPGGGAAVADSRGRPTVRAARSKGMIAPAPKPCGLARAGGHPNWCRGKRGVRAARRPPRHMGERWCGVGAGGPDASMLLRGGCYPSRGLRRKASRLTTCGEEDSAVLARQAVADRGGSGPPRAGSGSLAARRDRRRL